MENLVSNYYRNKYIDILKGLLMMLVIIGHLNFFDYNARTLTLIYSFHMPAFLIIGGFLSHIDENSKLITIIKNRIQKTLIPYFTFYLISFILIPKPTGIEQMNAVVFMFNGIGNPDIATNLPLWFLTLYFVSMTVFEVIEIFSYKFIFFLKSKNNNLNQNKYEFIRIVFELIIILILMTLSLYYSKTLRMKRMIFNFEIGIYTLLFVYIGKILNYFIPCIKNKISTLTNKNNDTNNFFKLKIDTTKILYILFLCIILIIWYILSMKNGRIDLNARDYRDFRLLYLNAILGTFLFSNFSYIVYKIPYINEFFSFIGKYSVYILAYHIPANVPINFIIRPMLPLEFNEYLNHASIVSILFLSSLILIISLLFTYIHISIKKSFSKN